jgi:thioesterase domain-containing protein
VQAYAERYVRIAEQVAEGRRIILAGWSYGGAVALEMARLWQEQGLPVEATILLDSFVLAPVSASRQGDADAGFEDIDFLGAGPMGEGVLLDRLASVLKANLRSFLRYFPERFSGRVELIKAGRGFPKLSGALLDDYDSTSRSWEHFLDYIATHEVDADHFDLLSEGSAEMTAKKMLNIMDLCHGA